MSGEFECAFCGQTFNEESLAKVQLSLWVNLPQQEASTQNLFGAGTRLCSNCQESLKTELDDIIERVKGHRQEVMSKVASGRTQSWPPGFPS